MVSLWITVGLIISALCVSTLGAYFSIVGIGALFSGAALAVCLMAGALEFSKFTLAAYLHQTWKDLHRVYRTYLVFAVVVLSVITSMGIFGFLSDAYQSSSTVYEAENIKLENIKNEQHLITNELNRLNRSVEEIPITRVTRRLKARAELEPTILELNKKFNDNEKIIASANLKILEVKKKVGPLIYIAKSLNADIDSVVKYLILIFVSVFDPLAICLVIASTHAIEMHRQRRVFLKKEKTFKVATQAVEQEEVSQVFVHDVAMPKAEDEKEPEDIVVQMNFKDANEDKKAV